MEEHESVRRVEAYSTDVENQLVGVAPGGATRQDTVCRTAKGRVNGACPKNKQSDRR